jgi:hypothetical protein
MVQERPKMTALPKVVGGGMAVEVLKSMMQTAASSRPARPGSHTFTQAAA